MRHLSLLLLFACGQDPKPGVHGTPDDGAPPGEDFTRDRTVRITAPSGGETMTGPFTVDWEAGSAVAEVRLLNDGHVIGGPIEDERSGSFDVDLDTGRYGLKLVGLDDAGDVLSDFTLWVRVAAIEESWVTITSPTDGDEVANPVTFAVNASSDIDEIALSADGWPIGTVAPGGTLTYSFSGTGYAREILAEAYDDGALVATDSVSVTVTPQEEANDSDLNAIILALVATYPTDGTNGYYWPDDTDWYGTTQDIYYLDELVAYGDPEGRCYCVGLTWEVYMRAFEEADAATGGDGSLNGLSVDDLTEMRIDWFVRDLWGDGVGVAMDNYGLGDTISDLEDAQPGDFIQFWRYSGSGHNAIFMGWERDDDGVIDGVRYWSTQSSTDGISGKTEYFGASGSSIDPSHFYLSRGRMPVDWEAWL